MNKIVRKKLVKLYKEFGLSIESFKHDTITTDIYKLCYALYKAKEIEWFLLGLIKSEDL